MNADPYSAPQAPLAAMAGKPSLAGPVAALLALVAAVLLMLPAVFASARVLAVAVQCALALGLIVAGVWQCVRHRRGQATCYLLAMITIITMFGPIPVYKVCALLCGAAAVTAAWGARSMPRSPPGSGLPLAMAVAFGASAGALATLAVFLWDLERRLAELLGMPVWKLGLLVQPMYGFAVALLVASCVDGICQGRRRWQWLLIVCGYVAYGVIGAMQSDYALPNTNGPLRFEDIVRWTTPFALGATAALGWRHWRSTRTASAG